MARVWKRDFAAAASDLDAAAKINPKNAVVFRARGMMAQRKGEWQDAIAAYTSALQVEPNSSFALGHRAGRRARQVIMRLPFGMRPRRSSSNPDGSNSIFFGRMFCEAKAKKAEAIAEARAVTAANPDNSYAHVVAANIYSAFHKDAEAMHAYDRAIALGPEAYIYLNRSLRRPKADLAGRRADLDAALELDPNLTEAIARKADLQTESGDLTGAISTYSSAIAKSPDDFTLLMGRGIAYARSGEAAHADADFQRARGKAAEPVIFNNMCWAKATAGVALESALADCNAALTKAPDMAGYLDSRGLVLLRLGRIDDAIADYDQALAKVRIHPQRCSAEP
jgi:Flp pilus assembly protein TadD